jgi:membrane associated rhomboid family serine protease
MARFSRTGFSSLSFPSFSGVTSQLVLVNVAVFFVLLLMQYAAPRMALLILTYFALTPALLLHGWIWQLVTYSFLNQGVLHVAFNMLTLWFIGSFLETSKGSRWLLEIYFLCAIAGGLIGSALTFTGIFHSSPLSPTISSDGALFGLLAAFAALFGDLEMYMFPLPIAIKAKYLVIVYMLIEVALLLSGGPPLAYFVILSGALIGFLFARRAPRRGMSNSFSERLSILRNNYYRWKRRQAARKFEVYMRKQNRDVRFDSEGRYIDPDEKRDPNDRKWMN